jgi:hypothetical protein
MSGSLDAPQFGQVIASGDAQPPQNRRPALFSVPQFGQITTGTPSFPLAVVRG